MKNPSYLKILNHPDKDEIISKLICGISAKDICEWLSVKYTNASEHKFVLSDKLIKSFKDNYLEIYNVIYDDLSKTKLAVSNNTENSLELSVKNNPKYKDILVKTANEELDIRQTIKSLCVAIETRFGQVFDEIQARPDEINSTVDKLLISYTETLGNILEKYYKFTETPTVGVVNNNVTFQVMDQHISTFHDVIKDVLSQMDLESALYFVENFNNRISKLQQPNKDFPTPEVRLAEAKLLSETISNKIN